MTDAPYTGLPASTGPRPPTGCCSRCALGARPTTPGSTCPGRRARTAATATRWRRSPARFLLAAIRLRGERGNDPARPRRVVRRRAARRHRSGVARRAGRARTELGQAKVEACSIALGLHLSRPWLWDRLDDRVPGAHRRLARRPSSASSTRRSTGSGSRSSSRPSSSSVGGAVVGGGHRQRASPCTSRSTAATAGTPTGPSARFDHYNGWALHVYPLLWADHGRRPVRPDACVTAWRRPASAAPRRRRPPRRRRRLAAGPGPQPDLPVRRRRAVLDGRPHRRDRRWHRGCSGAAASRHARGTSSTTACPTSAACSPSAGTGNGRGSPSRTPVRARRTGRSRACSA